MKTIRQLIKACAKLKKPSKLLRYIILAYLILYVISGAFLYSFSKIALPILIMGYLMSSIVYILFFHVGKDE